MSLVFLKNESNAAGDTTNDKHLLPYDWTNYFASPFVLPPNSQVAFLSATMNRKENAEVEEPNNVLWAQIGIPGLNRPMPIYLTPQIASDWSVLMNELGFHFNNFVGQTDFMTDDLVSPYTNGWQGAYSPITDKITLKCVQRLQPAQYGVRFNPMVATTTAITPAWTGINLLGVSYRDAPQGLPANTAWNTGLTPNAGVNPAVPTSCGSSRNWTTAGLLIGSPQAYGDGSWGMWYSQTGIKRSLGTAPAGGWGTGVGGAGVMTYSLSAASDGATATSQVCNAFVGVQSLQFMEGQEEIAGNNTGFIANVDINTTFGGAGGSQSNSRYALGVKIQGQTLIVERNASLYANPDTGGLPALGALGNSNHATTHSINLSNWVAITTAAGAAQPAPIIGSAFDNAFQVRFRWTSPYCMCVEGSTNYDQDTNTGDWLMMYDMATGDTPAGAGASQIQYFPSWFGDMSLVFYCRTRLRTFAYGNFDLRDCYPALSTGLFPSYEQSLSKPGAYGGLPITGSATRWFKTIPDFDLLPAGGTPEIFDPTSGYQEKEISLVVGPLLTAATQAKYLTWKPAFEAYPRFPIGGPTTELGAFMGLIKKGDDGSFAFPEDVAGVYSSYGVEAASAVSEVDSNQSIHIQLTDLPIQSRNGVSSQQTADIAVVHNWGDGGTSIGGNLVYQHYTNEKNWIDLNNIGEMTLNRLRVYCSYDDNSPASLLIGKTDVMVMFRKKPFTDTSYPNQPIGQQRRTGADYQNTSGITRVM